MPTAYAPNGLIGVLTPQANTTVEPEMQRLLPAGYAMLNARLTSPQPAMEARLRGYWAGLEATLGQFANAPLTAFAFACTGASYFAGPAAEDSLVERVGAGRGVPLVTAARAVVEALGALGAQRIGLVSPYPPALTEAAVAYWSARGLRIARVAGAEQPGGAFHPIYAMSAATAGEALERLDPAGLEAVVMLGTGMPTLGPIAARPRVGRAPVLSCMLALGWACITPRPDLLSWIERGAWRERL